MFPAATGVMARALIMSAADDPAEQDSALYPSQKGWAIGITVAVVLVALAITYMGQKPGERRVSGVLVGKDNRLSTSKTVAAAWTIVIAYIFISLILTFPVDWSRALKNFDSTYLLLLGSPYVALVAAKGIVSARIGSGTLAKPAADKPSLSDLVNDDNKQPDLFDVQFVVFNAIAIAFVLTAFAHASLDGFPVIPGALVVLTGGPAAVYVANKFFGADLPTIVKVSPSTVTVGSTFTISGQNLVGIDGTPPAVSVGADDAAVKAFTPASIVAIAPKLSTGLGQRLTVTVKTSSGTQATLDDCLQVAATVPTLYGASRGTVRVGDALDLTGDWGDVAGDQIAAIFDGSVLAAPARGNPTPGRLNVVVPQLSDIDTPRRVQLTVRVYGQISNPVTVEVSAPTSDTATTRAEPLGSYLLTR